MANLFQLLTLLPALIDAIKAAEAAIPMDGAGKAKFDLIMGMISDSGQATTALVPMIATAVTRIVATFNALGIFKKPVAA